MRKGQKWLVSLLIVLVDIIILTAVMSFAAYLQMLVRGTDFISGSIIILQVVVIVLIVVVFAAANLYPGYGLTGVDEIEKVIKIISVIFASVGCTLVLVKFEFQVSGIILVVSWVLSLIFVPLVRILFRNRISLLKIYGENVIVVGEDVEDVIFRVTNCRRLGWVPVGIYLEDDAVEEKNEVKVYHSKKDLLSCRDEYKVDLIILTTSSTSANAFFDEDMWIWMTSEFKRVVLIYTKNIARSVKGTPRDLEGILGLEFSINLHRRFPILIKRLMDIIISALLLVILSPLMLLIASVIVIDSGFPVIYRHKRVGKDFKNIELLKFRTMVKNADSILESYLENDSSARLEFERFQKLTNDPRVTRIGNFLRKFSLDELPQFFNVLRGEMSLIGPRAVTIAEVDKYGGFSGIILRALPGITGWWQVMGRNSIEWDERVKMELYYVSNWSIWLDYFIFLKTFWVILSGEGQ
jgi:Undecaprenyl-phosphate galactose phosphotransferase WbaP